MSPLAGIEKEEARRLIYLIHRLIPNEGRPPAEPRAKQRPHAELMGQAICFISRDYLRPETITLIEEARSKSQILARDTGLTQDEFVLYQDRLEKCLKKPLDEYRRKLKIVRVDDN